MRLRVPTRRFLSHPPATGPAPAARDPDFQGFRSLIANFTLMPNEILELKLPGLTWELRWTLVILARETIGDAYQRGGSSYDFKAIASTRWKALLELRSVNAVKTRLGRLEELGLIEVLPGERGPWGTTANRYRLRWANDGRAATRTFHAVMRDRARQISRKGRARMGCPQPGDPSLQRQADAPLTPGDRQDDSPVTPGHQPAAPPWAAAQADAPSFEETEMSTSVPNQSVSQSVPELNRLKKLTDGLTELTDFNNIKNIQSVSQSVSVSPSNLEDYGLTEVQTDGLTDRISKLNLNIELKTLLRGKDASPWPQSLRLELGGILDPIQVVAVEERSSWSAEGAWAILEAIRMKGRNLGNQAGTLWNALLQPEKGAGWLAKAGSYSGQASWRKVSGDGVVADTQGSPQGDQDQAGTEPQAGGCEARARRPEEFSPRVKAELRILIEDFQHAFRSFMQATSADRKGATEAFTRTFQRAVQALEPVLPLQVTLLDEFRPTEIRRRNQIKTNVLGAVYRALS